MADKGYHTVQELDECHASDINTILIIPKKPKQTDRTKPEFLRKDSFPYNPLLDFYTCPNGEQLNKQARYKRKSRGKVWGHFDRYAIKYFICKTCPYLNQCVSEGNRISHSGRYIDRYLNDRAIERNMLNLQNNRALYKKKTRYSGTPLRDYREAIGECANSCNAFLIRIVNDHVLTRIEIFRLT